MTTTTGNMEKVEAKAEDDGEVLIPLMTQSEFTDKLETHQAFVKGKSSELTHLTETLKTVCESKEPLTQVKNTLQEEINTCNKAINALSEEVTHLKQKLRYHSVRQIHDNIERLEYQLRNNNFKPREEQKILDEISMLRRSIRTLKEYEAKQAENKKYRAERTRLIEERNSNYSKIRALYIKEDEIKKEIAAVRGDVSVSRKSIDQLRSLRPKLEQEWLLQQQKLQAARNKRYEEKKRLKQEQIRERQEARRKLWEEYEASREPYEEEKNLCCILISYLQSSTSSSIPSPSTPASTCSHPSGFSTPSLTPVSTPSLPPPPFPSSSLTEAPSTPSKCEDMVPPKSSGAYYCKPKKESGLMRVSKRGKAKAKKEQRQANRNKELPHTPDVLLKFSKLSITPPRNTSEIPAAIVSLQDQLQHFHTLAQSEGGKTPTDGCSNNTKEAKDADKCSRPKSLAVSSSSQVTTAETTITITEQDSTRDVENKHSPTIITTTAPATHSSSTVSVYSVPSPVTIPAINVVAPGVSWACGILPNHTPIDNLCDNSNSATETESVYSNIPPTINGIIPNVNSVPELKICSDMLASSGSNESFFSMPVSYTCNMVEGKILKEPNNNGGFSYAAITAKVKPLDF